MNFTQLLKIVSAEHLNFLTGLVTGWWKNHCNSGKDGDQY